MRHRHMSLLFGVVPLVLAVPLITGATASDAPSTVTNTASQQAAPAFPATDPGHLKVLDAALANIAANYPKYAKDAPGAQDLLDYHIGDLWRKGLDGTGTTVAVIEGWDDPNVAAAVHQFDASYGLPDPVIQTIFPSGPLPAQCPPGMVALGSYGSCDAWAGELELDVISAHLIAPYAKILISATPADSEVTDDTASQVAMPEIMRALEYIGTNHLADSMSISDGTGESSYSYGNAEIAAQNPGELAAAAAGIPVAVATGDCGVTQNLPVANSQCGSVTTTPDTAAWDDSPWVTALGGSVPNIDPKTGKELGPDPVWHSQHSPKFSEGAGYSSVFARPAFQNIVAGVTGSGMRSVPDITMDAQDGTSEAAPLFAGVLALAAQLNHGPVGPVNQALYDVLGPRGAQAGIADVVAGNDNYVNGSTEVPGFTAAKGFDVASGWGTMDASRFVPALVAAVRSQRPGDSPQRQAADQLARLQHGIQLTSSHVPSGGSTYLLASGFLPGHPVVFSIDNTKIATLTASPLGAVSYNIEPTLLKLAGGRHTVTLGSMLITMTGSFSS
jgi:subtilase family serine protease